MNVFNVFNNFVLIKSLKLFHFQFFFVFFLTQLIKVNLLSQEIAFFLGAAPEENPCRHIEMIKGADMYYAVHTVYYILHTYPGQQT